MRLLVVEDDTQVASFIIKGLREARFLVDHAEDGQEALHLVTTESYDAIIMDVILPIMSGTEVVRNVRATGNRVPIIYLTAKDSVDEIVEGLQAGGDDYLTKPFSFVELLARVRAMVRRVHKEASEHVIIEDEMKMDLLSRKVWRKDREVELTNKEFELLEYFIRNQGQVLSRTMIAEHVWDIRFDFDSNVIDVHLARLRKKMESNKSSRLIHTVKGVGYVFRCS